MSSTELFSCSVPCFSEQILRPKAPNRIQLQKVRSWSFNRCRFRKSPRHPRSHCHNLSNSMHWFFSKTWASLAYQFSVRYLCEGLKPDPYSEPEPYRLPKPSTASPNHEHSSRQLARIAGCDERRCVCTRATESTLIQSKLEPQDTGFLGVRVSTTSKLT